MKNLLYRLEKILDYFTYGTTQYFECMYSVCHDYPFAGLIQCSNIVPLSQFNVPTKYSDILHGVCFVCGICKQP